jgi:enoyl-CoA hydratase
MPGHDSQLEPIGLMAGSNVHVAPERVQQHRPGRSESSLGARIAGAAFRSTVSSTREYKHQPRRQTFMSVDLRQEDGICTITINRPNVLNALGTSVMEELSRVIDEVAEDENIRVVIFRGAGEKAFSAGGDVAEMRDKTPEQGYAFGRLGHEIFRKIEEMPQPTIAAIHGLALGAGCELAMACDIRIASEKARFGQPEVGLGIIPGWGATQRLPRLVGPSTAMEIILSGRILSAQEAAETHLVTRVVPADQFEEEVSRLAEAIASKGHQTVRRAKRAVRGGLELDVEAGCLLEADIFSECFGPEQREGMSAFLEKRPPKFQ